MKNTKEHYTLFLEKMVEFFTEEKLEELARSTGFIKRKRKISGKMFLSLMSFGSWNIKDMSRNQLAAKFSELCRGETISAQSLFEKANRDGVKYLKRALEELVVKIEESAQSRDDENFSFFNDVMIVDSSSFDVNEKLKDVFVFCLSSDFETALDQQKIPKLFKEKFSENKLDISEKASVEIVKEGEEWFIKDQKQQYRVKKEKGKLSIYKELFPGCGGDASKAGITLQYLWNYSKGSMEDFEILPGKSSDTQYMKEKITKIIGALDLILLDLGYYDLDSFSKIMSSHAYFLSRLNTHTKLYSQDSGEEIKLEEFLKQCNSNSFDIKINLGAKAKLPVRLIGVRVPKEVEDERRRKAKAYAKKKGYTPSKKHLEALGWSLFITNVEEEIWSTEAVWVVYTLRWQIELIFKTFKSNCYLNCVATRKEETTLCFLWGKMFLIAIQNALYQDLRLAVWKKSRREISFQKVAKHFQALADNCAKAIFEGTQELTEFLINSYESAKRLTKKESRKRKTTVQKIAQVLGLLSPIMKGG